MGFENKKEQIKNVVIGKEKVENKRQQKKNWRKSTSITIERNTLEQMEKEAEEQSLSLSRYIEKTFKDKFGKEELSSED